MPVLARELGRQAFGSVAAIYDRARPPYPSRVFELLAARCGLGSAATQTFEIGPGTGQVTRRLLDTGARVTAIEPDPRLHRFITEHTPTDAHPRLTLLASTFENSRLPAASFDLGVAASSFHWLDPRPALAEVHRILRPGGWWAMWWNVFRTIGEPDPFQTATDALFTGLDTTPSHPAGDRLPFALDAAPRQHELHAAGFTEIHHELFRWPITLDTAAVLDLYATFSVVSRLPEADRSRFFARLADIVDHQFSGRVTRTFLTPVYLARRPTHFVT